MAKSTEAILESMLATFKERNAVYKDNHKNVANVMMGFFPMGVQLVTAKDFQRFHLFELMVVKLTRFCNSGLLHEDSVHDAAVYAALIESLIDKQTDPIEGAE